MDANIMRTRSESAGVGRKSPYARLHHAHEHGSLLAGEALGTTTDAMINSAPALNISLDLEIGDGRSA